MGAYILMRILESAPSRYDRGIRILTFGKIDEIYNRLASYIEEGQRVLDVGCGTGALTVRVAKKRAKVKGIDVNPQMLEIARKRVHKGGLDYRVELLEMGVAELGKEDSESYDAVMSCLCFSELTDDELKYTLKEIKRILKPGGLLLVADEVVPKNTLKRVINWLIRLPLKLIVYAITQTTTNAIKDLPDILEKEGFVLELVKSNKMGNFMEVVARKPGRG
ncbi:MAG: corrinoid protein-associated methyltransferase CpaM [Candidatus Asgardarchaeia archaeon]